MTQHQTAQHYVGAKIIKAWPATRTITNETHSEGTIEPGYAVVYEDGYQSWSPKSVFEAAYLPMGQVDHLPPHAQRVIAEKAQLDDKLVKLRAFLDGKARELVGADEFQRLKLQADAMDVYAEVLGQRIAAFTEAAR